MPKIEIPDVPDEVRQRLEAMAAEKSMSLSEFLLAELRRISERPGGPELLDRLGEVFRRAAASSRERRATAKTKAETEKQ